MDIKRLFSGIGVVIDDMLGDEEIHDKIIDIVSSLEKEGLPLVQFNSLPDIQIVKHLRNASFILLDWQLYRTLRLVDGNVVSIKVADNVVEDNNKHNASFVQGLIAETSVPIFIFSNKDDVKDILIANGLSEVFLNQSPIFIKRKDELFSEAGGFRLFEALDEWVRSKPAVYVLKEWSLSFDIAKESLLNDFSQGSQHWPKIIWDSAREDSVDESDEVSSLMMQNITSRMTPIVFDADVINHDATATNKEELLRVLQAQRYMSIDINAMAVVGDVFVFEPDSIDEQGKHTNPENREIAINIRPTCDCVFRDDPEKNIYLLYGRKLSEGAQKEKFDTKYHKFSEIDVEAIVGPIVDNSFYSIKFKDVDVVSFEKYRHLRKGRILEPFISHITERYSLYIQRHALPSLPTDAVCVRAPGDKVKDIQIITLKEENDHLKTSLSNLKENLSIISRGRSIIRIKSKYYGHKRRK